MGKRLLLPFLAVLLLLFCACADAGKPQSYAQEHEHVPTFSYEADAQEGQEAPRVRYCKICHTELPTE